MTNKTTMPIPFAFIDTANWKIAAEGDGGTPVITTDQAEAYANQRVKQALEEAEQICRDKEKDLLSRSRRMQHHHGAGLGASMCGDAIRALIPKE